jgi:hypothetical protein
MMIIENKFDLGELVYLITDEEQKQRMVTKIQIFLDGSVMYMLSMGTLNSDHYEKEISEEKNINATI